MLAAPCSTSPARACDPRVFAKGHHISREMPPTVLTEVFTELARGLKENVCFVPLVLGVLLDTTLRCRQAARHSEGSNTRADCGLSCQGLPPPPPTRGHQTGVNTAEHPPGAGMGVLQRPVLPLCLLQPLSCSTNILIDPTALMGHMSPVAP